MQQYGGAGRGFNAFRRRIPQSRAPAKADTEAAMNPKTQRLTIRIPHPD
jgi:hypothetical protein